MRNFLKKLKRGEKVTIVALGDSITEHTWHTQGRLSWTGLLQEALFETYGRNRCWVVNSGRCGDTAPNALNRLDEDVLRFAPDLVIVSFGMNDAAPGEEAMDRFRRAMAEIIRRVREASADVLLRTPNPIVNPPAGYPLPSGQDPGEEYTAGSVGAYAAEIVRLAEERTCAVVDHYTEWKQIAALRGTLEEEPNDLWSCMSDSVHPGPIGHLAFFRQMAHLFGVPTHFPWERATAR